MRIPWGYHVVHGVKGHLRELPLAFNVIIDSLPRVVHGVKRQRLRELSPVFNVITGSRRRH